MIQFIVEDGSGKESANSYCHVQFADEHFELINNYDWLGLSQDQKEAKLVIATMFLEGKFRYRFKGYKSTATQALHFPAVMIQDEAGYPVYGVPVGLQRATAELALYDHMHGLFTHRNDFGVASNTTGGIVKKQYDKVDSLETSTEYFETASSTAMQTYKNPDEINKAFYHLNGLLKVKLTGAIRRGV